MVQKIVVHIGIGGFGLSKEAFRLLGMEDEWTEDDERSGYGMLDRYMSWNGKNRACPELVAVVEKLGKRAGGSCDLGIAYVPDGVEWWIESGETGYEWVAEKHKTWRARGTDNYIHPNEEFPLYQPEYVDPETRDWRSHGHVPVMLPADPDVWTDQLHGGVWKTIYALKWDAMTNWKHVSRVAVPGV